MKRNQFFIALSLLACTLLSCQNEKKQQSSIANKSNMEKNDTILKPFVAENLFWIREPKQYTITDSLITIVSEPHTDLWQRTYYGFSNDNAPVLQMKTSNKFSTRPYTIDKQYAETLQNRQWIFEQETKTRKSCQQVMLTTYGLAKNQYSSIIQRELTMEDLFH
jgi:hypothetical protein